MCLVRQAPRWTYKAGLQVPAPAVVEETDDHRSGKVPDKDGQVGHLDVRHRQLHKLLRYGGAGRGRGGERQRDAQTDRRIRQTVKIGQRDRRTEIYS